VKYSLFLLFQVYKSVPSQTKPSSTSMAETIVRPTMAGTRETEDYSASFNKEKLGSLKSMFEQKKQGSSVAEPRKFVPDFTRGSSGVGKVASSSANNPNERDPNVIYSVAGEREKIEYKPTVSMSAARSMFEQKKPAEYRPKNKVKPSVGKIVMPKMGGDNNDEEVVKNSESVDDRPKELTTSLLSARAMFEGGNRASDSSIVKEVASWDGKGNSDVLGSAKAVFSSADAGENEEKPKSPEPVQLVEEPVVEEQANEEPTFEEPEIIECFTEHKIKETEVERVETPETPASEVVETPVVEHLQEEIVEQEQEVTQTPAEEEEEVLPETLCTTTENPEVVEQPATVEQHSEATTQPSVLEIDETAPTTVEPSPEVEEMKSTLEVNSPENASLQPSPAKNADVKVNNSTNQSKDDDYDSSDVLSDGATTTSQEGEHNQK